MTKNRGGYKKTVVTLIVGFIVVVVAGHFLFKNKNADQVDVYSPPSDVATTSADTKEIATTPSTKTSVSSTSEDSSNTIASCTDALKAEVTAKKESYAKGQILVAFNKDQSYKQAKDTLAVYGLVVQNENDSQSSFSSRHLVTAAVAPGQEITKVCQLRSDAHVTNAALDLYFSIHQ